MGGFAPWGSQRGGLLNGKLPGQTGSKKESQ